MDGFLKDLCKKPPHRCRSVVHFPVCLDTKVLGSLDLADRTDMLILLFPLLFLFLSSAEDLTAGDHLHVSIQFLHQDVLTAPFSDG